MSVEFLHQIPPEYYHLLGIPAVGFIGWLWRMLKEEHSKKTGLPIEDIEIDHVRPRYRGGTDAKDNLRPVSRPEHAIKHLQEARNPNLTPQDRRKEGMAVKTIKSRMKPKEVDEYYELKKKVFGK